jgi:PadR family transcriptional regulator PadR
LHGYGIAQALGGLGFGVPKGGSLYPALARLEEDGALEAAWVPGPSGPARREYTLTARGLDRLARERALMQSFLARTGLSSIEAEVSAPAAPVAAAGARQEGGTSGR